MPSNIGSQTITVKYHDPVNSPIVNEIGLGVRKIGIYSGGYLTKVSDTSVSLSTFTCEISDGTYQIYGLTAAAVTITVGVSTPYVCLRWAYTGDATADYMDFKALAVGDIQATDVVVGLCTFSGSTLTGFDYTLRTNPQIMDLFLKVEPTVAASMRVRVRAGRVNYGATNYDVIDQQTSLLVAPGAGSRIDVVYVDTDGAVKVLTGTSGGSPTAPDYTGKIALAQLTIASTDTTITSSMIKDVRGFLGVSLDKTGVVLTTTNQTVAGVKTFSSFSITPSSAPTTDYQVANKKYVDDSVPALGSWSNSYTASTVYQATTDLFVSAFTASGLTGGGVYIFTGASSSGVSSAVPDDATYLKAKNYYYSASGSGGGVGCSCFIKKEDYWKVTGSGSTYTIWAIPLGA